jgi:hypothetical protein
MKNLFAFCAMTSLVLGEAAGLGEHAPPVVDFAKLSASAWEIAVQLVPMMA